jgi:hypothetical protein
MSNNPRSSKKEAQINNCSYEGPNVRVNLTLKGEPAAFLNELKNRGLAVSNHDAIVQALITLRQRTLEQKLKTAQLKKLEEEAGC